MAEWMVGCANMFLLHTLPGLEKPHGHFCMWPGATCLEREQFRAKQMVSNSESCEIVTKGAKIWLLAYHCALPSKRCMCALPTPKWIAYPNSVIIVVPNLYDILSSLEHKRRYLKNVSIIFKAHNESKTTLDPFDLHVISKCLLLCSTGERKSHRFGMATKWCQNIVDYALNIVPLDADMNNVGDEIRYFWGYCANYKLLTIFLLTVWAAVCPEAPQYPNPAPYITQHGSVRRCRVEKSMCASSIYPSAP